MTLEILQKIGLKLPLKNSRQQTPEKVDDSWAPYVLTKDVGGNVCEYLCSITNVRNQEIFGVMVPAKSMIKIYVSNQNEPTVSSGITTHNRQMLPTDNLWYFGFPASTKFSIFLLGDLNSSPVKSRGNYFYILREWERFKKDNDSSSETLAKKLLSEFNEVFKDYSGIKMFPKKPADVGI